MDLTGLCGDILRGNQIGIHCTSIQFVRVSVTSVLLKVLRQHIGIGELYGVGSLYVSTLDLCGQSTGLIACTITCCIGRSVIDVAVKAAGDFALISGCGVGDCQFKVFGLCLDFAAVVGRCKGNRG